MTTFELESKDKSSSGVEHLTIKIDGKDVGVLYLTEEEKNDFVKLLKRGSYDAEVEIIEPDWVETDEFDDDDDDI
jgi:hypothetical protein